HRHPTDVAVREQPAGAHWIARLRQRQAMHAMVIELVPLQIDGHPLLDYEYRFAHRAQFCSIASPVRCTNPKGLHALIIISPPFPLRPFPCSLGGTKPTRTPSPVATS